MDDNFTTFKEFYPYYLSEHMHPICICLHFIGSWILLLLLLLTVYDIHYIYFIPIAGYGMAWIGHYFFEKNKPATFKYPIYSFLGDWVMFKDIIIGKKKIW